MSLLQHPEASGARVCCLVLQPCAQQVFGKHLRLNVCCDGVHQHEQLPDSLRGSLLRMCFTTVRAFPMQGLQASLEGPSPCRVCRHLYDQRPQGTLSCSSNCLQDSRQVLPYGKQRKALWLLSLQVVWQHEGLRVCRAGLPFL